MVDGPNIQPTGFSATESAEILEQSIRRVCEDFAKSWQSERPFRIESLLLNIAEQARPALLNKLLSVELDHRRQHGESPVVEEYLSRFKCYEDVLRFHFNPEESQLGSMGTTLSVLPPGSTPPGNIVINMPLLPASGRAPGDQIGRYILQHLLGTGGFAEVWRAADPVLDRMVAIKLMRRERQALPGQSAALIDEARRVARLNLAGVVPVYDIAEADGQIHIVSQYLEGGTLAGRMHSRRLSPIEAAQLTAEIAETLHQAHLQNLVHRDIKPSNILLDRQGKPWVADFGLAITEEEQQRESRGVMGTLAYMSPEQVTGGSHLVDARTDIYSLGIVLYQLLTGRLPFAGQNFVDYRDQIVQREPRPLRTIDDTLPPELERICLKCLAKAIPARYSTASDLAHDLRKWIANTVESVPADTGNTPSLSNGKVALASAIALGLAAVAFFSWSFIPQRTDTNTLIPRANAPTIQENKESTNEIKPTQPPDPLGWKIALGRAPQELIWPGYQGANSASLGFKESVRAYEITSSYPRFVALGELAKPSGSISIGIRQPIWTGSGAGIFLGYQRRVDQGRPAACFQAIYLSKANDETGVSILRVSRVKGRIAPESGTMQVLQELGSLPVKWPAAETTQRLEIQLSDSGLQSARWGKEELSAICAQFWNQSVAADEYLGSWGIFHEYGTTWFQDPLYTQELQQKP